MSIRVRDRIRARGSAGGSGSTALSPCLYRLAHYWNMDETGGTRADGFDSRPLTEVYGTTGSDAGKRGNAAVFSPDNKSVLGCSSSPGLTIAGDFSISLWYQPQNGTQDYVLLKAAADWSSEEWAVATQPQGDGFIGTTFEIYGDGTWTDYAYQRKDSIPFTPGDWIHIVGQYDFANKEVWLFINGVAAHDYDEHRFMTNGPWQPGLPFSVGNARDHSNQGARGRVDEIAVNQARIDPTLLYNSGDGRFYVY